MIDTVSTTATHEESVMKTGVNGVKRGSEVRNLVADVEELLGRMTNISDADIAKLHQRVSESVQSARDSLQTGAGYVRERVQSAATAADDYAHESPWPLIGAAAAGGLVIGLLISRR